MAKLEISLKDLYKIIEITYEKGLYKKNISNLKIMSNEEYDAMPSFYKENYVDYNDYKTRTQQYIAACKASMKANLIARKTEINESTTINIDDKTLWKTELDGVIELCNGAK